jgi:hypothetical protein
MKILGATIVLASSLVAAAAWAEPTTEQETPTTTPPAATTTTPAATTGTTTKPAAKTTTPKAMVIVGSTSCFVIRECALGQTPQQRSDQILDVFNKYLGGSKATFTVKPAGKNQLITMNKDKLIVVTPQDAKTAKAKNATQLAAQWKARLAKAFDETKAVK